MVYTIWPRAILPGARKVSGRPKGYKLAHAFLWECGYKRLKLAQFLGQFSVLLTWAGNRRFWLLSAARTHTKAPRKNDLLWETRRPLKRPGRARTARGLAARRASGPGVITPR